MSWTIHHGDCLEGMATLDAESVDAIVTDPPYGLSFMGKGWDHGVPGVEFWTAAMRVAKPGAHLLAFGGTRSSHRLACAIEDAGWEIRDCVMWVYGSGFPKSLDVSKAINKAAGAEREETGRVLSVTGRRMNGSNAIADSGYGAVGADRSENRETAPATPEAQQWSGWGTALKPAWEPITVARKPFKGTVAANVLKHGTGAINIDGCRVEGVVPKTTQGQASSAGTIYGSDQRELREFEPHAAGRWPSNLIHDGSEDVTELFPQTAPSRAGLRRNNSGMGIHDSEKGTFGKGDVFGGFNDTGSAARFFYCAKASKADRGGDNKHPTVKPTALMRYLCRLVTPPGGVVLDPFTGSGSTGKGAVLEGFRFIGIEREAEYVEIAKARIGAATPKGTLF